MSYPGVFSTCVRDRRRLMAPLPRSHVCYKMMAFNAPNGDWPRRMSEANLGVTKPGCHRSYPEGLRRARMRKMFDCDLRPRTMLGDPWTPSEPYDKEDYGDCELWVDYADGSGECVRREGGPVQGRASGVPSFPGTFWYRRRR